MFLHKQEEIVIDIPRNNWAHGRDSFLYSETTSILHGIIKIGTIITQSNVKKNKKTVIDIPHNNWAHGRTDGTRFYNPDYFVARNNNMKLYDKQILVIGKCDQESKRYKTVVCLGI